MVWQERRERECVYSTDEGKTTSSGNRRPNRHDQKSHEGGKYRCDPVLETPLVPKTLYMWDDSHVLDLLELKRVVLVSPLEALLCPTQATHDQLHPHVSEWLFRQKKMLLSAEKNIALLKSSQPS